MKPSALQRLSKYARTNPAFIQLLRDDRRAALREAAKAGIKLSPEEGKLLKAVLSGDRVVVTPQQFAMISSLSGGGGVQKTARPDFWPIRCLVLVLWNKGKRSRFSKERGKALKQLK